MKDKMKKLLYKLPSIIFSIAETSVIILTGRLLRIEYFHIGLIMLAFCIVRIKIPKPMHYKKWYHCIVWTTLVFLSLFVIMKLDLKISIVMSAFFSIILSSKGNIEDIFMWKGRNTNYADIEEFIKYNEYDTKLIEFENKLKEQTGIEYLLYKYRFKQGLSYSQISEKLDIETPRIAEKLEKIAFAIRIYCRI